MQEVAGPDRRRGDLCGQGGAAILARPRLEDRGLEVGPVVVVDPGSVRPAESAQLVGDAAKARRELGWQPTVSFEQLVRMMVQADLADLAAAAP